MNNHVIVKGPTLAEIYASRDKKLPVEFTIITGLTISAIITLYRPDERIHNRIVFVASVDGILVGGTYNPYLFQGHMYVPEDNPPP